MARRKQSLLNGALILSAAAIAVHLFGLVFKIYLTGKIGMVGRGYFSSAYNIYTPIYSIAVSGLPVAISTMVARCMTLERYRDVLLIHKISVRLFVIVGIAGTVLVALLAYPYACWNWVFSINMPKALPAMLMLSPALLCCCIVSAYRGFYAGMRNMIPHGVSQVIEAVGKLIFGCVLMTLAMDYGYKRFNAGLPVYGTLVTNESEALSAMWPWAAAAAILGVTLASAASLVYMILRYRIGGSGITAAELEGAPEPDAYKEIRRQMIAIAIPVVLSSLITNLTNLIDVWSIQNRLDFAIGADIGLIKSMYSAALAHAGILDSDLKSFLYGAYDLTQDIENLIPNITVSLGLSALPVLSEAWTKKSRLEIRGSIESVLRITMVVSLPAGLGIAVLPDELLHILYGNSAGISVAAPILAAYGCAMCFISVTSPLTNMLQAVNRLDVPIKAMACGALAKIVCNYIFVGMPRYNVRGAAVGTVLCYIIITVISLNSLLAETKIRIDWKSVLLKPLLCSVICTAAAVGVDLLFIRLLPAGSVSSRFNGSTVSALIAIAAAVIVYALAMLFTRSMTETDIKMLPKGEKIAKVLEKHKLIG